uniref:UBA domain-containing protein n=1 Tax=Anopheles coluzzii TaxID=1518534 RepID=A0A8W7P8Q1_ANOCL
MLRELIAWVLNNYLGKYVENLNTAQLTIALLSGQVELENLPLRKDALRHFGLPLQIVSGTIGKVKLTVPVRAFRTASWCLYIDNVQVTCGPIDLEQDWNAEVEQQTELDLKVASLDRLEAKWRAQRETPVTEGSYYASSYSGWLNYGTTLVTNIIENLQLTVNGIHVRYEDGLTIPHQHFACGIKIDSLSAQSCDASWTPGKTANWSTQHLTFKLVELTNFSMYWDPRAQHEPVHMISPISVRAQLRRDRSETPLRTRSRPRLVCDLIWDEIRIALSDIQYNQMMQCVRGLDDIARYRRFKLQRPTASVGECARDWWRYAVRCHGLCRHLGTDPYVIAKENMQYIRIYMRLVANPNEVLTSANKQFKDRIERDRTFDELRLLRDVCMMQMPKLEKTTVSSPTTATAGKSLLVHYFPQWWYSKNNNNSTNAESSEQQQRTPPGTGEDDAVMMASTAEEQQLALMPNADGSSSYWGQQDAELNPVSSFEDEILDALAGSVESNSLLKRDAVFGKFNFILKRGTLDFCSSVEMAPKLQFLFQDLKMDVESRPRSGSHYVGLSLGSILIKDRLTPNSQFPDLVKPQQKDELNVKGSSSLGSSTPLSGRSSGRLSTTSLPADGSPAEPIFQLQYERKPLSYDTDYRLMVKSESLDIVYNMDAVRWLVDFLAKPHQQYDARRRLEDMKNKTKQELMKNWNYIIEGHLSERKTWTLEFDISAPQIIFVDNFSDRINSTIVVVDFGRLQLTNGENGFTASSADVAGGSATASGRAPGASKATAGGFFGAQRDISPDLQTENDEEDAFMTPCSTPPGSEASTTNSPTLVSAFSEAPELTSDRATTGGMVTAAAIGDALDEYQLYQRLYDRYHLQLTDLQVLVCHAKERWTAASLKSTSNLHVLDRFSIVLQVERRVVYTSDPQYPSLTLSGTLPKLNAHINEYKVSSILTLANKLSKAGQAANQSWNQQATSPPQPCPPDEVDRGVEGTANSKQPQNEASTIAPGAACEEDASRASSSSSALGKECGTNIVVFQFTIDQMSLEVQSRGRSVAELQVSGVKAGYSQRPEDISLTLSVHGLLLVDAMQSFGQDFELLIASHRHVGMDSLSGSLRQSEPCSPCSPASPDPNMEYRRPTSPLTISKALSNLQRATSPTWNAATMGDLDALITVEIVFVTAERPEDKLQVANIQFNNLDIIANQETIVELLGFIKRVIPVPVPAPPDQSGGMWNGDGAYGDDTDKAHAKPASTQPSQMTPSSTARRPSVSSSTDTTPAPVRLEITFDFHRLNVLVLRALIRDNYLVGRKVGTFTMSEAKIHATLGSDITVEGSLGGLQVLDLTPEGVNHQRILSVGKDPLTDTAASVPSARFDAADSAGPDLMASLAQEVYGTGLGPKRADHHHGTTTADGMHEERQALSFCVSKDLHACIDIRVKMASVWFIHCARFMQELSWCATEFKHYLKNLARSIREKATDMALGLVQSRSDLTGSRPESIYASPRRVRRQRTVSLSRTQDVLLNSDYTLKVDITLDTPVLILPRSSSSPQVLVAHLGRITVSNTDQTSGGASPNSSQERIVVNLSASPPPSGQEEMGGGYLFSGADRTSVDCNLSDLDGIYEPTDGATEGNNNTASSRIRFAKEDSTEFIDSIAGDGIEPGGARRHSVTASSLDRYKIDFRNINLYSLDTTNRKGFRFAGLPRAEEFYSCKENAIPIIHDTIFSLEICREQGSDPICGDEESDGFRIVGCVVKPLRLSLKRQQYEQLLETIDNLFKIPKDLVRPPSEVPTTLEKVTEIAEESLSFHSFPMPSKARQGLFYQSSLDVEQRTATGSGVSAAISIRVHFELPAFIIQLNGNRSEALVQISFRDFCVDFDKRNQYETHVKISLRSLLMEDLLQSDTAKNRYMVVTSAERDSNDRLNASSFASHSCPNPVGLLLGMGDGLPNSLPTNLEDRMGFSFLATNKSLCPDTPPPSPSVHRPQAGSRLQPEENLVIYSSVLVDPSCPTFATQFGSLQQSSLIDFNSLDLIVSVESWFVLLDFFGLLSDDAEGGSSSDKSPEPSQYSERRSDGAHRKEGTAGEATGTPNQPKSGQQQTIAGQSKLEISVRSLSLVLAKPTSEIAKANVSNAQLTISKRGQAKQVEGSLGSITLSDLTPYGTLYREKFMTTGSEALSFKYVRDAAKGTVRGLQKDAQLTITMSSVRYTHTKRFIAEIQLFFKEFSHLQTPMMRKIKPSDVRAYHNQRPTQLGLAINAGAPIILLPMSYNSDQVIVADLGEFTLTNEFRLSALDREVLDVMHVNLFHTDIFAARMEAEPEERFITIPSQSTSGVGGIDMKGYRLVKKGPSLLKEKCHLKLEVERNLDSLTSHFDITVHGKLTKLDALLDLQQYRLIRGFLSHNLGEPIDELYLRAFSIPNSTLSLNAVDSQDVPEEVWKNLSINLELLDVSVRLVQTIDDDYCGTMEPLACVNFIKSKLLVDCFSDGAQDIDLVSQQIQLIDTRFLPSERQCPVKTGPGLSRTSSTEVLNVFPNILQPIRSEPGAELVQAEIHSRRRKDLTKFTILLNNMRLMAILDWLENARDFILQQEDPPPPQPLLVDGLDSGTGGTLQWADRSIDTGLRSAVQRVPTPVEDNRMELKLNITDSELVFVEKTDQHDTNAVILKSTTVVSYRPFEVNKTLSINLKQSGERTALSIIDPVTINMDVKKGVLEIQMQKQLCIRLSYHDVRMFRQMLESLPKQTKNARDHKQQQERRTSEGHWKGGSIDSAGGSVPSASNSRAVEKLIHLGFRKEDCLLALERCSHQLDEAALWLTQNKEPRRHDERGLMHSNSVGSTGSAGGAGAGKGGNTAGALNIIAIEMKSPCISICVIDDCRDADVPLVELSLSKLDLRQELGPVHGSAAHLPDAPSSADPTVAVAVDALAATFSGYNAGRMAGVFAVDYYNRVLSGWEPMIESWKLEAKWGLQFGDRYRVADRYGGQSLLHVPLTHVHAVLYFRPLLGAALDDAMNMLTSSAPSPVPGSQASSSSEGWTLLQRFDIPKSLAHGGFQFTDRGIQWADAIEPGEIYQELRSCRGPRDKTCKMLMAIRKEPYPSKDVIHLPGHVITIFPPMRIHNLLPCELLYRLPSGSQGRISSSDTARITEVDIEQPIALSLTLDSYPNAGQITIPAGTYGSTTLDVRLFDMGGRMLKLSATIVVVRGRGVQISIGAPYWLVNRTGLPLVFRQDDLDTECAGQFSENEEARMITPFMFAFSDPGCSGSVTMRLGRRFGGSPNWCQPFKLEQGTQHRQLRGPSETFIIGIEVRRARGKYGQTSIVTFSPRYQLYNRSSYTLQVLQKCLVDTTTVYDPTMVARSSSTSSSSSSAACIEAVPGCHIPFHWPRLEREHELCVRLPEVPECLWSGGIPITSTGLSLYINIRNMNGAMHFLRLETILHGATYFMIFSDAQALPPPIRLDNYSHVPITFAQADMKATFKTVVRPQCSIAYVLDEPTGAPYLQLEAPGGDYSNCRLDGFEPFRLMYENFIYIAFSQTFETGLQEEEDGRFEVRSQQLVLGVVDGRVLLVRKQAGDRSQLWRMNNEKQLEHEGTSPPSEPGRKQPRYVLDLEKPPQPMQYIALVVRPANRQRRSTQTWHFTEDGRLMCEHSNMCVQARGGFFGLRAGSEAVLGMCVSDTKVLTQCGVPYEQAIERQKLRPGSGCLSVSYRMDGPIKSIQIRDVKAGGRGELTLDSSWKHVSHIFNSGRSVSSDTGGNGSNQSGKDIQEYHVQLKLRKGIGLSLISNQPCEELAYVTLENIHMECIRTPAVNSLDFSVGDMQIDNQLFETSCPIMLYTIGGSAGATDQHGGGSGSGGSSLQLNVKQLPSPNTNAVIFEHFIVSIRPVAVYLEERLFLRMVKFFGFAKPTVDPTTLPDETDYEAQKIVYKVLDSNVKRYYFGDLRIIPAQIRLSFVTASKLTAEFAEIKRNLGFTFIKFEDAVINFEQFAHKYHFETMDAYVSAIKAHYKQELKWQAASILGSVDFLGNPLGFANDLSEGFSGLLLEGSISSLVKNVTHGISNSTAKLTETISDGLGKVVFDDEHVETRQRILDVSGGSGSGTTGDHLVAGFRGFTFGLLGGVTSIVKHTYQGTASDGLSGFITGLGKGLVGTVTKPVIGVLDLASETANAVREQSKGSNRILPERKRPPRTVTGAPGGLLPPYSYLQSTGQQYLFLINKRNFAEQFMAYEPCLLDTKDSKMRLLVSAENVWGFSKNDETTMIVFNYPMSEIISCQPLTVQPADLPSGASQGSGGRSSGGGTRKPVTYIEFCLSLPSKSSLTPSAPEMVKRPRVRCQNEEIAKKICYHVNFAKCIYDEREQTLNINTVIE